MHINVRKRTFKHVRLANVQISLRIRVEWNLHRAQVGYIFYSQGCNFFSRTTNSNHTARIIAKTYLYNFDPLKPHFYIIKLGFTGVYIIFLISAQEHRLWVLVKPPRRGGSNEYPNLCFEQKCEKYQIFLSESFHFLWW